ncbi:MAG: UDP-N-acetylmuramoyl-L-alanine--D-glutamate ligase [Candidatus Tectimicrobiota bacterium]
MTTIEGIPFARSLKDRRVVVVGLGRTGMATTRLLVGLGAQVSVTDAKPASELAAAVAELPAGVECAFGGHPLKLVRRAHLVVTSPGVAWDAPPLAAAREAGVEVISEMELAWRLLPTPWVAVTGSNGKSTTTTLIGQMAHAAGLRAVVGGNIGNPVAGLVEEAVGADYLVAEISTFQLEGVQAFRPSIAVALNVTEDHLDRHGSFAAYADLKRRIYAAQGVCDCVVLNDGDPLLLGWGREGRSRRFAFRAEGPVDRGAYRYGQEVRWRDNGREEALYELAALSPDAQRNVDNVLAATCTARLMGVEPEAMVEVLGGFRGLEHRLEEVATIDGVTFINDSKGTNVGAVMNALKSMDRPVILIAGGQDKGGDFSPLCELVAARVRGVVLIGEAAERLGRLFNCYTALERADSLQAAVRAAFERARPGEVVLLSPACASFDMFQDFEERGLCFKEAVRALQ